MQCDLGFAVGRRHDIDQMLLFNALSGSGLRLLCIWDWSSADVKSTSVRSLDFSTVRATCADSGLWQHPSELCGAFERIGYVASTTERPNRLKGLSCWIIVTVPAVSPRNSICRRMQSAEVLNDHLELVRSTHWNGYSNEIMLRSAESMPSRFHSSGEGTPIFLRRESNLALLLPHCLPTLITRDIEGANVF